MDQLVVLQEIYLSHFKGAKDLESIDPGAIEGSCPELIAQLLEGSKKGHIEEAVCLKLADRLEDVFEIKRLGDICREAGLFGISITSYNKALSLCNDESIRSVLFNNLGQAYARQGDTARAVVYYQKAVDGFERTGDATGLGHVLGNLGAAQRLAGDWDRAIESSYRGLKIFEEAKDELGVARLTGSLARVYFEMGESDLAARYFERALKDFQRLGDKKSAARVLDWLGRIAQEKKDWEKSLSCFHESLSLLEEMGQSQSAGVVLCSLGRTQLEMGEAKSARESLERAAQLVPKSMQPAHQNVLSALAATYSALAKDSIEKAESTAEGDGQKEASRASEFYALASDRYLELAQALKVDNPDVRVAAEITKSRSYLSGLDGSPTDAEALALVEKAAAALKSAERSATGTKKGEIEGLQRTLAGMREAWSVGLMEREPWKLMKSVSNAAEFLQGGCTESCEAEGSLCMALKSLSASMEAERARKDPLEKLEEAAGHLRHAEESFMAEGTEDVRRRGQRIGEAAGIIEGLAGREKQQGGQEASSSTADIMRYKPQKDAILLIAKVLMNRALFEIDDTSTSLRWDEALNLTGSLARPSGGQDAECVAAEAEPQVISRDALPVLELSADGGQDAAEEAIEAGVLDITEEDGEEIDATGYLFSGAICSVGNRLVPVRAGIGRSSSAQLLLKPEKALARTFEFFEPALQKIPDASGITRYESGGAKRASNSGFAGLISGARFRISSIASRVAEGKERLFSRSNALKLIKALLVVIFLLLAIEAILYLI
jgi:tetratricopeptide (TPR) repeat protein